MTLLVIAQVGFSFKCVPSIYLKKGGKEDEEKIKICGKYFFNAQEKCLIN